MGGEEEKIWTRDWGGCGGGGEGGSERRVQRCNPKRHCQRWGEHGNQVTESRDRDRDTGAERIPTPPSVLTRPDTPRSRLPPPPVSSRLFKAVTHKTWARRCSAEPHAQHSLAAVVGVLSVGGVVRQERRWWRSTGPGTGSVNLNLDLVEQQCSFPLTAQILEVIGTLKCEELSLPITSGSPSANPGACTCTGTICLWAQAPQLESGPDTAGTGCLTLL